MSQIHESYLEAKVDYQILEQKVRQCQDTSLLPGMNALLKESAIALNAKFFEWNEEVDKLLDVPELVVTHQSNVIAGWWDNEYINQTPGAA